MNFQASFIMDRSYFTEAFGEWLVGKGRLRRWQRVIGIALLALGIIIGVNSPAYTVVAITLGVIGVFEFSEFYFYRWLWIHQRLKARELNADAPVELQFDESGINHMGPTMSGHIQWGGVKGVYETPLGVGIQVGDGGTFYVPKRSLQPSDQLREILGFLLAAPLRQGEKRT